MQAYEFNSVVGNGGIIHIPQQYLTKIFSPVKVIILTNEKVPNNKNENFSAISLETKGFKFNRDEANER
ncbi:MAG: hypothetical protein FWD24_00295 [Treponema sp.]|nr:hypothetical protein [Treponema sp.]